MDPSRVQPHSVVFLMILGLILLVTFWCMPYYNGGHAVAREYPESFVLQYRCDTKGNYVQVQLLHDYTDPENSWDPWTLVDDGGTGRYIKKTKTIQKSCVLSDGIYIVEIGPEPCSYDTLGRNGAMMMAWAKVSKDGKQLARADFGACTTDVKVTTKLQIRPGQEAIIEEISGDDYFKD